MNILTAAQIRESEQYTIAKKSKSGLNLMEVAALSFYRAMDADDLQSSITILCGKGNNGGDGLALARMLNEDGVDISVIVIDHTDTPSPEFSANLKRLAKTSVKVKEIKTLPLIGKRDLIIDALLGTGLSRPLTGLLADVVKHVNGLTNSVLSIDVPTGLFCEDNTANDQGAIIQADRTFTFHCLKQSFLFAENAPFIGDVKVLDIGLLEKESGLQCKESLIDRGFVSAMIHHRHRFSHKGTYGHALLVAGSYGCMGAAVLAAKACMRSGVGLLTAHVPVKGVDVMQVAVPEAMCSIDDNALTISHRPKLDGFSAVGVGPGIGQSIETAHALKNILQDCIAPLVIDADALNILSENKTWLSFLPANTVLTPHPKEFDRLAGPSQSGYERWQKQRDLAMRYNCVIVLKGAYTSVCNPAGQTFFNTTGNPGMATAGSGDVLTGIALGLLAQGYSATQAALLGVYIHGLAGDLAKEMQSQEALIASDLVANLGRTFQLLTI